MYNTTKTSSQFGHKARIGVPKMSAIDNSSPFFDVEKQDDGYINFLPKQYGNKLGQNVP